MDDIIYQLALSLIKGIGPSIWKSLMNKYKSAECIFNLSNSNLSEVIKNSNICNSILNKDTLTEAELIVAKHKKVGVKIISYCDNDYPYRLKEIYDAPCFLYCIGKNILNDTRMLGVIGTREPTNYGIKNCREFIRELAKYDITTISGLAYGIDVLAHQESLNNNIPTLAVVAGGVDIIYPSVHREVYDRIIKNGGCIISEFGIGTKHDKFRFPLRNRIIAGLSDGILIIEAGEKSGTEITALCGNEYNRDVFAIPGNINSLKSLGCNNLIKANKASLVTNAHDIAEMLNWNATFKKIENKENIQLDKESLKIYNIIKQNNNITFDEIYQKIDIDSNILSSILLKLEISNYIRLTHGNKYII